MYKVLYMAFSVELNSQLLFLWQQTLTNKLRQRKPISVGATDIKFTSTIYKFVAQWESASLEEAPSKQEVIGSSPIKLTIKF